MGSSTVRHSKKRHPRPQGAEEGFSSSQEKKQAGPILNRESIIYLLKPEGKNENHTPGTVLSSIWPGAKETLLPFPTAEKGRTIPTSLEKPGRHGGISAH